MKRMTALILSLILALSLAVPGMADVVDMSGMEPAEFTFFMLDPNFKPPHDDCTVAQTLREVANVSIKFIVPPTDGEGKLNLMLAGGEEMPDIIALDNRPVTDKLIEAGKLLSLEALLEEHAPVLIANYGEKIGTLRAQDGNIYQLPGWYPVLGENLFPETRNGFIMRTGFLEANGWYEPKTFEDVYNILKKYQEEDGSMIPLSLSLAEEGTIGSLLHIANAAYGGMGNGDINVEDGKLVYARTNPKNKEFFRLLNRMYNEGMIDQEAPVLKTDLLKNKLAADQVYATFGEGGALVGDANRILEDAQAGERFHWFFPKQSDEIADDDRTYARYGSSLLSFGTYGISSDCKDPVRLMQFLNYLGTEEGFMALNGKYDFEGKNDGTPDLDWYIDVNKTQPASVNGNEVYITDWLNEQLNTNVNSQEERGLWKYSALTYIGSNALNNKYDWVAMEIDSSIWWSETERKINVGYGKTGLEYFSDLAEIAVDITDISGLIVPPESDAGVIYTRANDYHGKQIVKCIAAPQDQFDAIYDQMVDQINSLGIDQWEDAINEAYQARLAQWYGEN